MPTSSAGMARGIRQRGDHSLSDTCLPLRLWSGLPAFPARGAVHSLPFCDAARGAQDEDSTGGIVVQEGDVTEQRGCDVYITCCSGGAVLNQH